MEGAGIKVGNTGGCQHTSMTFDNYLRGNQGGDTGLLSALATSLQGFFPMPKGGGLGERFFARVVCYCIGMVQSPKTVWLRGGRYALMFSILRRAFESKSFR